MLKYQKFKNIIRYFTFAILMLGLFAGLYSFVEPYLLQTKTTIISDRDLPSSFDGTKIVFASDIHHGPLFSRDRVKSVVDRINKLNPDIILLGGDYVHRGPQYIEPCFEELKDLKAPSGVFGVLGNHDHWESAEKSRENMKKAGITLLDNSAQWIRKSDSKIKIGGVGDLREDKQDITPTINDVSHISI